jgi:hypothetical protein
MLSYLEGVSNWGPKSATGVAEVVMGEGEVRITVTGLPKLDMETYEAWLYSGATGDAFSLGRFNTADNGTAQYEKIFDNAIKDKGYDVLLLSVESAAQQVSAPSEKHSIAGFLVSSPSGGLVPSQLPRTGGATPFVPAASAGVALLAAGLAIRKLTGRGARK